MHGIQVSIVAFVESSFPGWVRAVFTDAHGREWSIVDKVPVLTDDYLDENSQYPVVGFIAVTIINRFIKDDRGIITVDLCQPWGISTEDGQEIFDFSEEQLVQV